MRARAEAVFAPCTTFPEHYDESGTMRALVPDTNTYLHFRCLEDVDWREVGGVSDIVLVVPITVVEELDRRKYEARTAQRAREVLRRIGQLFADGAVSATLRTGVDARLFHGSGIEQFDWARYGLDRTQGDDRLFAQVIEYRANHPDEDVVLVTDDTGVQLRSRRFGITVMPPLERSRLDAVDVEARGRREAGQPKVPTAEIQVSFIDGANHKVVSLGRAPSRDEVRQRRAPQAAFDLLLDPKSSVTAMLMNDELPSTEQEMALLTLQMNAMPALIDRFFELATEHERFLAHSFRLALRATNVGAKPAEVTDVTLQFPPVVDVMEPHAAPKAPVAPQWPRVGGVRTARSTEPGLALQNWMQREHGQPPASVVRVEISSTTNGPRVAFHVKAISNFSHVDLPELLVALRPDASLGGFPVSCSIRSNSVPRIVEQTLHVRTLLPG